MTTFFHRPSSTGKPAPGASLDRGSPLADRLVGFWPLGQWGGADLGGRHYLTPSGAPGYGAGRWGLAQTFVAASSQYLARASEAALHATATSFTVTAWAWLDATGVAYCIASMDDVSGNREWSLQIQTSNLARFLVGSTFVEASSFGTLAASRWYFLAGWRDVTASTQSIQINCGAIDSAAAGTPTGGAADFRIGARANGTNFLTGRVESVGYWKRVLAQSELRDLYTRAAPPVALAPLVAGAVAAAPPRRTLLGVGV